MLEDRFLIHQQAALMFTTIKSLPLTFYSAPFYANLLRFKKGIGARFMLVQIFLMLLAAAILITPNIPNAKKQYADIINRLPDITISNQKLSMNETSPYSVRLGEGPQNPLIIFDTTSNDYDAINLESRMKAKNALVLVTSDFIAIHTDKKTELHNFSDFNEAGKTIKVDHDDWVKFGKAMLSWMLPIIFVSGFLGLFIWQLIATFFQGLVVLFFALFSPFKPDISGAMRLSAAAGIPVGVMDFLFQVTMKKGLPFLASAPLWIALIIFGLHAANKASTSSDKLN